jgi:hypothetical protein
VRHIEKSRGILVSVSGRPKRPPLQLRLCPLTRLDPNGYAPSHNVQIATDAAHGIIVGASVAQAANDQHEMAAGLAEVERQSGQRPEHLIVDEGYTTRENILAAAEQSVDLICSR